MCHAARKHADWVGLGPSVVSAHQTGCENFLALPAATQPVFRGALLAQYSAQLTYYASRACVEALSSSWCVGVARLRLLLLLARHGLLPCTALFLQSMVPFWETRAVE